MSTSNNNLNYDDVVLMASSMSNFAFVATADRKNYVLNRSLIKSIENHDIPINIKQLPLIAHDLNAEDINRLSGKVEKIYERKETDFENLLKDLQKIVARSVRYSHTERGDSE